MAVVVTLRGPKEIIDKIVDFPNISGIELDEPQFDQSLSDAVDSPVAPQEIEHILQLITVAITTASAGVTLFEKIQALLRRSEKESKVAVVDPKNNKTLSDLAVNSDLEKLSRDLFS